MQDLFDWWYSNNVSLIETAKKKKQYERRVTKKPKKCLWPPSSVHENKRHYSQTVVLYVTMRRTSLDPWDRYSSLVSLSHPGIYEWVSRNPGPRYKFLWFFQWFYSAQKPTRKPPATVPATSGSDIFIGKSIIAIKNYIAIYWTNILQLFIIEYLLFGHSW